MPAAKRPPHTSITVRNLPPEVKQKLRLRAARHGRSLEAEARDILTATATATAEEAADEDIFERIHARFAKLGGVRLRLPARDRVREPPDFSDEP